MIQVLIQLLHSRAGAFFQWLAGLLVGWLTAQAVALGIEISPEAWTQLQVALTGFGAFLVTFGVQWYQARQTAKLQSAIGSTKDSWIGTETLTDIEALVKTATVRKSLPGN